jgi:hypothetical protein
VAEVVGGAGANGRPSYIVQYIWYSREIRMKKWELGLNGRKRAKILAMIWAPNTVQTTTDNRPLIYGNIDTSCFTSHHPIDPNLP